jgi:hypothetical protein
MMTFGVSHGNGGSHEHQAKVHIVQREAGQHGCVAGGLILTT